MASELVERHVRPPIALRYMARAFRPSSGLPGEVAIAGVIERWERARFRAQDLAHFSSATGLPEGESISVLHPHALAFRLQMALLTHPRFPLPIWGALQTRNHLVRHARFGPSETLDLETRIAGCSVLDKGVEIDVVTRIQRGATLVWESLVTYFYRGRFGVAQPSPARATAPDVAAAPIVARLTVGGGDRWRFGRITGDYNGIHQWDWYARRFGFRGAFTHPQRLAGLCLATLAGPVQPAQALDLWIKGPVQYGADVVLRAQPCEGGAEFGAAVDGDPRPALLGRWTAAASASTSAQNVIVCA